MARRRSPPPQGQGLSQHRRSEPGGARRARPRTIQGTTRRAPIQNAPVDSSDLPPPPPAAPPPAGPQTIAFGGGEIVFGTDQVSQPTLEFAAYRHRRHKGRRRTPQPSRRRDVTATTDAASPRSRRRHRHAAETATVDAEPAAGTSAADTPYQTVVRPGEKLSEVAERVHSSRAALDALNDIKHPRHLKPGTVLKIPYRYSYEVQKGDTLYTISRRFDQDPDAMAKLNGLKHAAALQPGETINLPVDAEDTGKRDHATAAGPQSHRRAGKGRRRRPAQG